MNIVGTWIISEMENWDKDYYNMEVQAYFKINKNKSGEFHFGLVQCDMDGEILKIRDFERYDFSFDGIDENDQVNGRGWIIQVSEKEIEGKIFFHQGDSSSFKAKRKK